MTRLEALKTNEIEIKTLRKLISFNPETGELTWRERMSNPVRAGDPALSAVKDSGHLHGLIYGIPLQAHRVAWAIHYGEWPHGFIDHINGVRDDNRIVNLRDVSRSENAKNRRPNKNKKSGLPHGVSQKKNGRYFSQIMSGGKSKHLGYFDTPEEAKAAFDKAKMSLGFHSNHGTILSALIAEKEGE
jgi:hypothetical protein